jgi:hypothetical protein
VSSAHTFEELAARRARELLLLLSAPTWQLWKRLPRDPELRKLLGRMHGAIRELQRHSSDRAQARARELLLVEPSQLSLDAALELTSSWDQLLVAHGDTSYVCSLLEVEYARGKGGTTATTWADLYGADYRSPVSELYRSGAQIDDGKLDAARNELAALFRTRWTLYQLDRARLRMKARHLWLLAPVLLLLVSGLVVAIAAVGGGWRETFVAAIAGALGGAASGTYKLRDHVTRIAALRAFEPAILVQPLLGAGAGLFLLLALESDLLRIGNVAAQDWQVAGAVGFVAGFSEPFFLGVVNRVAGLGEKPPRDGDPHDQA